MQDNTPKQKTDEIPDEVRGFADRIESHLRQEHPDANVSVSIQKFGADDLPDFLKEMLKEQGVEINQPIEDINKNLSEKLARKISVELTTALAVKLGAYLIGIVVARYIHKRRAR